MFIQHKGKIHFELTDIMQIYGHPLCSYRLAETVLDMDK